MTSAEALQILSDLTHALSDPSSLPSPIYKDVNIPGLYCPNVPIDKARMSLITDAGRNAGLCVRDRCIHWRGHCIIGVAVSITEKHQPDNGDRELCPIKPNCRWYRENGSAACRICSILLHHQLDQTVDQILQGEKNA